MAHLKGEPRARYVIGMFVRIARRYDILNTLMSGGRHHAWRRMAVDMALYGVEHVTPPFNPQPQSQAPAGRALDIASGTGDFAIELARRPAIGDVVGVDFVPEMLSVAQPKVAGRVALVTADAHALPLGDDRFMYATVGFGVRNFVDLPNAIREMVRVLGPRGRLAILEIVRVDGNGPLALVFRLYFRYVTPWLGALFAGDREAYTYLPKSAEGFLSADELTAVLEDAGLAMVATRKVALGSVAILVGEKPASAARTTVN